MVLISDATTLQPCELAAVSSDSPAELFINENFPGIRDNNYGNWAPMTHRRRSTKRFGTCGNVMYLSRSTPERSDLLSH